MHPGFLAGSLQGRETEWEEMVGQSRCPQHSLLFGLYRDNLPHFWSATADPADDDNNSGYNLPLSDQLSRALWVDEEEITQWGV